jgi:hypothetical protein
MDRGARKSATSFVFTNGKGNFPKKNSEIKTKNCNAKTFGGLKNRVKTV